MISRRPLPVDTKVAQVLNCERLHMKGSKGGPGYNGTE